jgi:hypothetical protein
LLEGLSAEQIADIKATSIKESKISGITEYEVLFRNIESRNFVCPLLHIKLGIGNDLPNEIKEFISKELEYDLPYVNAQKLVEVAAVARVGAAEDAKKVYIVANKDRVREMLHLMKEHISVPNNVEFAMLKAKVLTGRALTEIQVANLAKYEARVDLAAAYVPGSQAALDAQEASIEYAATITRLTLVIDSAKASLSTESKKYAEMRKNVLNRPIEKEFEKILAGFDVVYQQYYTMTLVGEHIRRLLTNCEEICLLTKAMMLLRIPEDSPRCQEKRAKVEVFMGNMMELMDTFDYLCSVMQSTDVQSEDAIDVFCITAEFFGEIYRRYLSKNGTQKLHRWNCMLVKC